MAGSPDSAHPIGRRAAAAVELPWLKPWLADEVDGASVNAVLGILIDTTIDPERLTVAYVAGRGAVHPQELIQYNRGQLDVREHGQSWVLTHRGGHRVPLRVRRTRAGDWELIGPVIDDRELAAADHRAPTDELRRLFGRATLAAGLGRPQAQGLRVAGAAIADLGEAASADPPSCELVAWSDGAFDHDTRGEAVCDLLIRSTGIDPSAAILRTDPQCWRVWLARRRRAPVATVGFAIEAGHCALAWIVSTGEPDDAAVLLIEALREAAALDDALSTTARVADATLDGILVQLGYRILVP